MLDYEDEILLEQYITYNHMKKSDRDLCMHLISNLKEIEESNFISKDSNNKYDIISMNFNGNGYVIIFNGFVSNGDENRYIDGYITRKSDSYYIETNYCRLSGHLNDDERDFSTSEVFTIVRDSVLRKTIYTPFNGYYEELLPSFDEIKLNRLYYKLIGKEEKCLRLED